MASAERQRDCQLARAEPNQSSRTMTMRSYNVGQELVAACQLLKVDVNHVLEKAGWQRLKANSTSICLTPRQIALVFTAMCSEYGRDDFHIKLANGFAKAAFGPAFLALQCSKTLREGIHRAARLKQELEPVEWSIEESKTSLRVKLNSQSPEFPFGATNQAMSFLWLVQSCRNITAAHITPTRLCVTGELPHKITIEQQLNCPIEIGREAFLEFPADVMDAPVLSSSFHVSTSLDAATHKICNGASSQDGFLTQVRSHVLELLPTGVVTSERVARQLALSKRTLVRRLSDQGCSFSEIVRECRLQMADHYLRQTDLSISDIGVLVGYREVNSFYRAFKAWHGKSPQELRKKLSHANRHNDNFSKQSIDPNNLHEQASLEHD